MPDLVETLKSLSKFNKSIEKLIDNVSSGIGRFYEPTHIKRITKAKADAKLITTNSEIESNELLQRAEDRNAFRQIRRQHNIEAVLKKSASYLTVTIDDSPVAEDWIVRFFEYAQDIGNPDMQSLWANILAQEVSKPSTFSLRTLEFIKTLQPEEARIFTKYCSFLWINEDSIFTICENDILEYMHTCGVGRNEINVLIEIGLVKPEGYNFKLEKGEKKILTYFNKPFSIIADTDSGVKGIEVLYLTKIGSELAPISGAAPDNMYINTLKDTLNKFKWLVEEN